MDTRASFAKTGLGLYYPAVLSDTEKTSLLPETLGKMYLLKTPVLGIFGTSSQQGKFTLQLQLRKRFLHDGCTVGQLGTEPESRLFGMDEVYPFGYMGAVSLNPYTSIQYLNYCMAEMDRKDYDVLIVEAQSGTLPIVSAGLTISSLPASIFCLEHSLTRRYSVSIPTIRSRTLSAPCPA